jgi:hypothetical protein
MQQRDGLVVLLCFQCSRIAQFGLPRPLPGLRAYFGIHHDFRAFTCMSSFTDSIIPPFLPAAKRQSLSTHTGCLSHGDITSAAAPE